jgi:pSer/pThr/pTyr-binding forkhead associated (FHA) protein
MSIRCSLGHDNPDGSVFCDECGERLSPASASAPSAVAAPPVPVATPRLIVEADGTSFDLSGKSEILIGREDPTANVYPDVDLTEHGGEEGGVSRQHARLYAQGSQYMVEDQNSTNCTFLNRQKLPAKTPTPIKDGDELRLGRVVMTFHLN